MREKNKEKTGKKQKGKSIKD